jgi:solute carrier family 50 protein (sugar transporter)
MGMCCVVLLQVSNGFGCGLGAMQLMLYFIYRVRDNKKPTPEESVEMGLPKTHPQEKKSTANGSALQGHD